MLVFAVVIQPILQISAILEQNIKSKKENLSKMWERRTFCAVCKSKPQKLPFNLLQNESSSDEKYCFTINSPLARTIFTLNNALPVEFLIDIGSSVNIINQDTFQKLES